MAQGRERIGAPARLLLRAVRAGGRLGLPAIWRRWEPVAMWFWRVRPVGTGSVLQFGVSRYRGPSTVLADGTVVAHGARILHLHLDNARVADVMRAGGGRPWVLVRPVQSDLDVLAGEITAGHLGDVVALRGVTVLARMAARLGFEVRPLDHNLRWAVIRNIAAVTIAAYHPDADAELERGVAWPGEIWMSAAALEHRLLPRDESIIRQ